MKKSYVFTIVALLALVICGLYFNDTYIKWTKGNAESNKDSNKVEEPIVVNDTAQPPDSVQKEQSNNGENSSKKDTVNGGNGVQSSSSNSDTHNGGGMTINNNAPVTNQNIIKGDNNAPIHFTTNNHK
ncbi:MAG: hypothetical protein PUC50_03220 [Bacteroidales bacterium]|nr:hypothetical protein [Bacteroidales bacterium]